MPGTSPSSSSTSSSGSLSPSLSLSLSLSLSEWELLGRRRRSWDGERGEAAWIADRMIAKEGGRGKGCLHSFLSEEEAWKQKNWKPPPSSSFSSPAEG